MEPVAVQDIVVIHGRSARWLNAMMCAILTRAGHDLGILLLSDGSMSPT